MIRRIRPTVAAVLMLALILTLGQKPSEAAEQKAGKAKVAVIRLSDEMKERPEGFSLDMLLGGTGKTSTLSQLVTTLNKAAKDPTLGGVLLELRSFELSQAQTQELGGLIKEVRQGGKRVIIYSADYDMPTYLLASYADTVIMPEQGFVLIPGVQMGLLFVKGLLDKLDLRADLIQVGQFKGAEEAFTRTEASPQFQQQINGLADSAYNQMVSTIAANRALSEQQAKAAIDEALLMGKRAKELKLVDELTSRAKLDDWLNKQFAGGAELVSDYGQEKKESIDLSNPFAFFKLFTTGKPKAQNNQPAIAVIYANGPIMPDQPEGEDWGDGVVSPARIRKAVDKALKDDRVRAIVLRVDSPGGSASASDEIWQILREADKTKPVTASMGRIAASGGYYISCSARSITADPATITGSIGVVGGKLILTGLLDKVGVNVQQFQRGQRAGILSPLQPFSNDERAYIRKQMEEIYGLFTARVQAARGNKIARMEDVAQGRLFTGNEAVKAGLVDQVGTLHDTILAAAKAANIEQNYQVLTLPEPKTLADILREGLSGETHLPAQLSATFQTLPLHLRREMAKAWLLCQTLQNEQILMALPVGIME